ncbi:MAG: ABC transporter substrate-binding protein [Lachnospiraceae bacterium]|nr:ABC transporter substrate-binding protein [Lachnospiraceae bacterium]
MKRFMTLGLAMLMVLNLTACGKSNTGTNTGSGAVVTETPASETTGATERVEEAKPETIVIKTLNGNKEEVDLEVPYDPERIAILDMASLDILDNLGVAGERIVGSAQVSLEYLDQYADNDEIVNLGSIKEADLEAVMACDPDVIFIGGRLSASYDALSEIAPVVYLATDLDLGVIESVTKNATIIASMFGLEDKVAAQTAEYAARIDALQAVAEGNTALVGMTTSGSFNLLGNDGRCSIIGKEIGFENLVADEQSSSHGNESSFEVVVKMNPDYVFVMDRDSAISSEGAQLAREIMENELVMGTDAYKNGNIVYIQNPAVWYTAEGGITALDIMLADLEAALLP